LKATPYTANVKANRRGRRVDYDCVSVTCDLPLVVGVRVPLQNVYSRTPAFTVVYFRREDIISITPV